VLYGESTVQVQVGYEGIHGGILLLTIEKRGYTNSFVGESIIVILPTKLSLYISP
jgi:hypothetical protein